MKKNICILVCLLFFLSVVSGQSVLEEMWEIAQTNCKDVVSAQKTLDEYLFQYKYRWSSYKPSFSVSSNFSYTDSWEKLNNKPSAVNGGVSYSQNLPGSLALGTDISYGLSRSLYDLSGEADFNNLAYNHTASFSVSVTQSLFPFWLQGYSKDPLFVEKSLLVDQAQEKKEAVQKKIVQAVTSCWIHMRMLSRSRNINTLLIDYTDNKIRNFEELLDKGQIGREKIWEEEITKQSYSKEKISLDNEYNEQRKQLLSLLGNDDRGYRAVEQKLFFDLPQQTKTNGIDVHEKNILKLEKEIIFQKQILLNQCNAPFIKLGSGFSCTPEVNEKDMTFGEMWNEKKNWNWNISVSIDLSSLFSMDKAKEKQLFQIALHDINNTLKNISDEYSVQKEYYTAYIASLKESQQIALKILENYAQKKDDYETLYNSGGCTLLDVQTCEVQFLVNQMQYENLMDELWYYSWLCTTFY